MIIDDDEIFDYLSHHGVKGMRWGVRKGPREISRRTDRAAAKDAREFARAKMFFGEGAGTRRKLIDASVKAKSAKDPAYAKAFEKHLATQDMSKHAEKARSERKSTDRNVRNKQRAGALLRSTTGQMGTQAAIVAAGLAGAAFVASPKGRSMMKKGVSKLSGVAEQVQRRRGAAKIMKWLNTT
jgi:hypothetical protein